MNCQRRIIPARAGPTVASLYIMPLSPDHPRSCGANEARHWPISDWSGSIPARAGPTTARARPRCARTDHPRSCGANDFLPSNLRSENGSSPLVRGQRVLSIAFGTPERIIPARAGPTQILSFNSALWADHPRSCGANLFRVSTHLLPIGSSPLVRGQRFERPVLRRRLRIIPARAGPTTFIKVEHSRFTDHPRSCGANGTICRDTVRPTGSSPLVRGQRPPERQGRDPRRIIPARAGPTRGPSQS